MKRMSKEHNEDFYVYATVVKKVLNLKLFIHEKFNSTLNQNKSHITDHCFLQIAFNGV